MWIGWTKNPHAASLAWRLGYITGVIWIAAGYYRFICVFLGLDRRKSILLHYAIGAFFMMAAPSHLFFKHVDFLWDSVFYIRSGPLHYLFFIWWISLVSYSHYLMLRARSAATPEKKNQIMYFALATAFGFMGGSLAFLPNFGIDVYPWSHFTVFLYPIIMSYAILRHRLMDINVVIRKTLLYSLVSASLAGVYVGTITLLAYVLGAQNGPASAFSSALAAIFITLLFNPLRIRMQRWLDRHFPRERLDPALLQEAAGGFAHEMKRPLAKISLPAQLILSDLRSIKNGEIALDEVLPYWKNGFNLSSINRWMPVGQLTRYKNCLI